MSTDAASPGRSERREHDLRPRWELPEIRELSIRRVPIKARELRNFKSRLARHRDAVEFLVETYGPIPARGSGPALFVGDTPVVEGELVEDNLYRFLAFDPDTLEQGATISFGWTDDPPEHRNATKFRFTTEDEGGATTGVPA
jgi:hypothetical protein